MRVNRSAVGFDIRRTLRGSGGFDKSSPPIVRDDGSGTIVPFWHGHRGLVARSLFFFIGTPFSLASAVHIISSHCPRRPADRAESFTDARTHSPQPPVSVSCFPFRPLFRFLVLKTEKLPTAMSARRKDSSSKRLAGTLSGKYPAYNVTTLFFPSFFPRCLLSPSRSELHPLFLSLFVGHVTLPRTVSGSGEENLIDRPPLFTVFYSPRASVQLKGKFCLGNNRDSCFDRVFYDFPRKLGPGGLATVKLVKDDEKFISAISVVSRYRTSYLRVI